jgi:dihydropteroate synthase
LIMAVLNVTPDSFSDGGELPSLQAVVDRAGSLLEAGADVLDLGGESTRPGAGAVSAQEELDRVLPALAAIRRAWPDAPVSIDSYKANVAEAAIKAGADIINDVWGLTAGLSIDDRAAWNQFARKSGGEKSASPARSPMAEAAARLDCPVIAMHNRPDRNYGDFWPEILGDLKLSLAIARHAGIRDEQLWLDPGFGFAKSPPQNLEVIGRLEHIVALGHPVLVGTSRKSTLGLVLGTKVDDRIEASGATVVWAIQQGARMVRVHDVKEMARFVRMADAMKAGLNFSPTPWTS